VLTLADGEFTWSDHEFSRWPLTVEQAPSDEVFTKIIQRVGQAAKAAKRVIVPFDRVAPAESEWWHGSTANEVLAPLGPAGAKKLQYLKLGKGTSQHVLIAGKTGSGKSTLMHAMITSLALQYSPDEIQFYLIDFKKGVEFKLYDHYALPHARVIAIESEREFGLSVTEQLDRELKRRGDLFRELSVQNVAGFRQTNHPDPMPRIVLLIDEFQEIFVEDDKIAQDAALIHDRLVRQAISHFDRSRIPEGITASRYPSAVAQYIPPFSLIWIAMVHDYWMHRDDPEFVRGLLPGMRSVLAWFERHVDETGMVGPLEWWPFVDWAVEWPLGVPPGGDDGHSTVISLQYVYALERAADIEQALGLASEARHYRARADSLKAAVGRLAWDSGRGLVRDEPDRELYSQHANTMAVLVGAVPDGQQWDVMEAVLADSTLTQATYYFGFYVLEALARAGLGDRYVEQLEPWRAMLALGLTTTPEQPEPTRSDSHAWSAHPNHGLLATVLGIRPAAPGFRAVRIAPHLGPMRRAGGTVPHPGGTIEVELERDGEDGLIATVALPAGLSGVFEWRGDEVPLAGGRQTLTFGRR
jgi:energy-coupling factor transporter ATP-binding protein EcfA2